MNKLLLGGLTAVAAIAAYMFGRRKVDQPPNCVEKWAVHHGGTRDLSKVHLIVIHSTESGSASGSAGWFQNPDSQGSAHVVLDDVECYRTLPDNVIPWGAQGGDANQYGLHLELTGYAAWTRDQWMTHRETLKKGAAQIASWGDLYDIPMKFLTAEDLKNGNTRGVTTHANISKAYGISGGHTDPGVGFPVDMFMKWASGSGPASTSGGGVA